MLPFLVIEDLKDIELTCAQVADKYNISSQTVHNWFMERIHIGRSKLTYMIKRYEYEIIASFKISNQNIDGIELTRKLLNGPMKSFNRKPKDLKRASRGFSNFDYVRNRIMWASSAFLFTKTNHLKTKKHKYKNNLIK